MARKKKLLPEEQQALEQEQLNREIRADGQGESQVIKELLSDDFVQMSNLDAQGIALLLQQIIKGQNSLLSNYEQTNIQIAKLKEHQDKVDKRIAKMISTERREVEDVLHKASKLKATGAKKDKIIAQGAQMYTKAVQQAKASRASDKLKFEDQIRKMPTELVISPGEWINTREGMRLIPQQIRIKHKIWTLPVGVPTTVPKIVAERMREIMRSTSETDQRKALLGKQVEQSKLAEAWQKIEGSKALPLPLA
jgi:hypothetical protein